MKFLLISLSLGLFQYVNAACETSVEVTRDLDQKVVQALESKNYKLYMPNQTTRFSIVDIRSLCRYENHGGDCLIGHASITINDNELNESYTYVGSDMESFFHYASLSKAMDDALLRVPKCKFL